MSGWPVRECCRSQTSPHDDISNSSTRVHQLIEALCVHTRPYLRGWSPFLLLKYLADRADAHGWHELSVFYDVHGFLSRERRRALNVAITVAGLPRAFPKNGDKVGATRIA